MKNILLYFLLLTALGAYAQNDSILPNVYAHYTVQGSTGPFEYLQRDYILNNTGTGGDTLIVSLSAFSITYGGDTATIDTVAYIALDGYKAYIKKMEGIGWMEFNEEGNDWELLYDFSLQVGDTACDLCYLWETAITIQAVDTIYIQGVPRKVLTLSIGDQWIQGMGSIYSPLAPKLNFFEYAAVLCGAGMVYNGPSPIDSSYYHTQGGCNPVDGLNEPRSGLEVLLSPNPAVEFLSVRAEGIPRAAITVYDLSGRVVHRGVFDGKETRIPTEGLSPGMYLVQLRGGHATATRKFVVQ